MLLECTRIIVFVTNLQEVPVFAAIICVDNVFNANLQSLTACTRALRSQFDSQGHTLFLRSAMG